MKSNFAKRTLCAALVSTTLGLVMISATTVFASDASKGKKVAFFDTKHTQSYVATLTEAFVKRAESHGMQVDVFTSMLDAALQAQQIDDAIARKYDLLAIIPGSEQAVVPALVRAKAAGIPVVLVNNSPKAGTEKLYVSYVGVDMVNVGRQTGHAVVDALKANGHQSAKIALITGALQMGPGPRRVAGFKEVLEKYPNYKIVAVEDGKWDTAKSELIAGQLFARFAPSGGLDVVFGMADNQAVAAVHAAKAAKIKLGTKPGELMIVGSNCMKQGIAAIEAGEMYSTLSQIPTVIGAKTADVVDDYFNKKSIPKNVLIPGERITKANAKEFEVSCGF
jgi:ribose transport system substrate-binding protein